MANEMNGGHGALQSLIYTDDDGSPSLKVLDCLLLPAEKTYVEVPDLETTWAVIRNMQIRGAPLIAIVAMCGLAVDLSSEAGQMELDNNPYTVLPCILSKLDYLCTSRPTAVNLFNAVQELKQKLESVAGADESNVDNTPLKERLVQTVCDNAKFCLERDLADNHQIGANGADLILNQLRTDATKKVTVVTICNTGSLATAGYGTALGIVRALHERGALEKVVALETRPYNQGSRLTAFELVHNQLPNATLICDSMAAALMSSEHVDAVVVGADRVCANGDTANKIGTYNLALIAAAHHVPVLVAAPLTTLDVNLPSGDHIKIEERPPHELLSSSRAAEGIGVWNPAFDVTPARLIAGIVTERGVIWPASNGTIDVAGFVEAAQQNSSSAITEPTEGKLQVPYDYQEQTVESLPGYLVRYAKETLDVLGVTSADELSCVEMGDGNLNLVFIVTNKQCPDKQVIVKQSLPYVRCVGESWPLTLERGFFEYKALVAEKEACPEFVPSVFFFSKSNALIVMEYLPPPNIILRKGLIQGIRYPTMAADMGTFCAKTLFKTSGFKLSATELRQQVQDWSQNSQMCALTEQVVFTEPYIDASNNRWTSPQLDEDKKAIENDVALKLAAGKLKVKFVTQTQALVHADLHSGSVMAAPEAGKTFVIDPEFAFYGPMGFDLGAFIANLFLAYTSQPGHDNDKDYPEWILEQIKVFWTTFVDEFLQLWNDPAEHTGYLYSKQILDSPEAIKQGQEDFIQELLAESLGFAGMKMLRRVVGIAHVEDLESIEDADVRAPCERRALETSKQFIKAASSSASIDDAIQLARDKKP